MSSEKNGASFEAAMTAAGALEDKKGEDIRIIDISGVSVMADYFVIASSSSQSQTDALIENTDKKLRDKGFVLKQSEGVGSSGWVLLDYGDVIVHIFDRENRLFYDLERIWKDGKEVEMKKEGV